MQQPLKRPAVDVVLGFYNGHKYIVPQVQTILNQRDVLVNLHIFDDASAEPLEKSFVNQFIDDDRCKIHIKRRSENLGYSKNFLWGLAEVPNDADYFAFSDQDDIWLEDKLKTAVDALRAIPAETPALYCSRTRLVKEDGQTVIGDSSFYKRAPSFQNALVQNICAGNTILLNKTAKRLIEKTSKNIDVISHDWWSYLLISGAGGKVIYDTNPTLLYRQHDANVLGAKNDLWDGLRRLKFFFDGRFKRWNSKNDIALAKYKHLLTPKNIQIFKSFRSIRSEANFVSVWRCCRLGIRRQSNLQQTVFLLGILLSIV